MNEIDPRARLALELARTDAEPSVADKLRVLQALQARLGTPPVIPTGTGERGAPQSPAVSSGAQSAAGLGKLVAVGAIAAVLGLGAGLGLRGTPTTPNAPVASSELASADTAAPRETSAPVAASLPLVPVTEPSPVAEPASTVTSRTSSKPPSERKRSTPVAKDDLFQALELLRRSQRALRKQEPALSLALLDELEARFAPSVLGEERQATRVLALCLSGDEANAARIARALLAENPATIYAARVRESCAGGSEQSTVTMPNAGK